MPLPGQVTVKVVAAAVGLSSATRIRLLVQSWLTTADWLPSAATAGPVVTTVAAASAAPTASRATASRRRDAGALHVINAICSNAPWCDSANVNNQDEWDHRRL